MSNAFLDSTPERIDVPTFLLDRDAKSVTWGNRRCYLGDTTYLQCLAALADAEGAPVENTTLLNAIDTGYVRVPNDVRTPVYRLKKKLRRAGMADLADRIENVSGAYKLRLG